MYYIFHYLRKVLNAIKLFCQFHYVKFLCRGKKVAFYGGGKAFSALEEQGKLKDFNVVGIIDRKFEITNVKSMKNYKGISPYRIFEYDIDVIIITMLIPSLATDYLKQLYPDKIYAFKLVPLFPIKFTELFKRLIIKLSLIGL